MSSTPKRIAVIGAGAAGLSAAFDLLKQGHAVTVFEASDKPGGLAAGFKQPNWNWTVEKFYHHWFASDADMLALAAEMGVSDKVRFMRPVTVSYYKGDFLQLDSPLSALLFKGLSLLDKIPFGLSGIYLKLTSNWKALERFTAHEWLSRWMGKGAYELLFEPLLVGKFGEAKANWMIGNSRNLCLYPNVYLMDQFSSQIRVFRPIAVDRTEVTIYCIAPKGEAPEARAHRIRQYEDFFNATGMATPDDLEEFRACQEGYMGRAYEWNDLSRGANHWVKGPDAEADSIGLKPLLSGIKTEDEGLYVAQHSYWLDQMKKAVAAEEQA